MDILRNRDINFFSVLEKPGFTRIGLIDEDLFSLHQHYLRPEANAHPNLDLSWNTLLVPFGSVLEISGSQV
jgi:hypothetical protein